MSCESKPKIALKYGQICKNIVTCFNSCTYTSNFWCFKLLCNIFEYYDFLTNLKIIWLSDLNFLIIYKCEAFLLQNVPSVLSTLFNHGNHPFHILIEWLISISIIIISELVYLSLASYVSTYQLVKHCKALYFNTYFQILLESFTTYM